MLTPDPHVTFPWAGQSWNRYSYVMNSPLNLTDPAVQINLLETIDPIAAAIFRAQ